MLHQLLILSLIAFPASQQLKIALLPQQATHEINTFVSLAEALLHRQHSVHVLINPSVPYRSAGSYIDALSSPRFQEHWIRFNDFSSTYDRVDVNLDLELEQILKDCENTLADAKFLTQLQGLQFDLMVIQGHADMFCWSLLPVVLRLPFVHMGGNLDANLYGMFAYTASDLFHGVLSLKQTWFQALLNLADASRHNYFANGLDLLARHAPQYTDWESLLREAQLVISTRDLLLKGARNLPPNVVEIPGVVASEANPQNLPYEVRVMLSSSETIVFVGINSSSSEFKRLFLDVFTQLPEVNFIWLTPNARTPSFPENVLLVRQVSTYHLLGHPNLRLLVTRGDNDQQYEAMWTGVPMLALPTNYKQRHQAEQAALRNISRTQCCCNPTSHKLAQSIRDALRDDQMRAGVLRVQEMLRQSGDFPLQTAARWIEHVGLYGSSHLRPSLTTYFMNVFGMHSLRQHVTQLVHKAAEWAACC